MPYFWHCSIFLFLIVHVYLHLTTVWILVNRVIGVNGPRDAMPVVVEKSAVEKMLV